MPSRSWTVQGRRRPRSSPPGTPRWRPSCWQPVTLTESAHWSSSTAPLGSPGRRTIQSGSPNPYSSGSCSSTWSPMRSSVDSTISASPAQASQATRRSGPGGTGPGTGVPVRRRLGPSRLSISRADVRPLLPLVRAPTLILHRRDNAVTRVGHGRHLAEHIPGARYVELPGADDLYWAGDTDAMLDEIEEFLTGIRHSRRSDRTLATILFTDIVGSTPGRVDQGDRRWRDLLLRHDEAVRRQLRGFRGRQIKSTGQGMLATFDGPARAVSCACAIRDAAGQLGLDIRAGVHAGEVEAGDDGIDGIAVRIAAQVEALAGRPKYWCRANRSRPRRRFGYRVRRPRRT